MSEIVYKKESYAIVGACLMQIYQPDFVCFEKIILELKAVSANSRRAPCAAAKLSARNWL